MTGSDSHVVRIRVRGTLDPAWWSARFADLSVEPEPDGTTRVAGLVADQAALHGLLATVRDLGLTLVSLDARAMVDHDPAGRAATDDPGGDAR